MRHFITLTLLVVLMLVGAACNPAGEATTPTAPVAASPSLGNKPSQVIFMLDWAVLGRHAPYFLALDKGYFADENIALTIVRGYSSTDSIKQVAAGSAQFAFADIGTLLLARGNDAIPVKAVAVVYAKAPHLLICNADLGIKVPGDLEGRTIGAPAGNSHRVLFPAFAKLNNIDPQKVNWLTLDASLHMQSLLNKNVDCIPEYFAPLIQKKASETNFGISTLRYSDFGMDFYSNSIVTSEEMAARNPDLVRRFVRATLRGLQYSFDHPDEAAEILQKYHRENDDHSIIVQELKLVQELALSDEANANGLGFMDPDKIKATRDLIAGAFSLNAEVNPEDIYTNEFLARR